MRKIILFFILFCYVTLVNAYPSFKIADKLKGIQILSSVFVIEDQSDPAPAYSMVVQLPDNNLLIIDSPYTSKKTKVLINWLNKKFGQQKITAINTHYHLDRVGGNEIYEQEKIPVYGSDLTAKLLFDPKAANNKWKIQKEILNYTNDAEQKQEYKAMEITAPDHLFPIANGKTLLIGNKKIEIYYPGPAHSPDNIVVYIPHLKLLFGGCMIAAFPKIYLVSEANVNTWPNALAHLKKFKVDWVIPGHPANIHDDMNFSPDLISHTEMLLKKKLFVKFSNAEMKKLHDW